MKRGLICAVLCMTVLLPSSGQPQVTPDDVLVVVKIAATMKELLTPTSSASQVEANLADIQKQLGEIQAQLEQIASALSTLDARIDAGFDREQIIRVAADVKNINDNFHLWKTQRESYRETAQAEWNALHKDVISLTDKQRVGIYSNYNTVALAMGYEYSLLRFLGVDATTRAKHMDVYVEYFSTTAQVGFSTLKNVAETTRVALKGKHAQYLKNPLEGRGTVLLDAFGSYNTPGGPKCEYASWTMYHFAYGTLEAGYTLADPNLKIYSSPAPLGTPAPGMPCIKSPSAQVDVPVKQDFGPLNAEVAQYRKAGRQIEVSDAALKEIARFAAAAKRMRSGK